MKFESLFQSTMPVLHYIFYQCQNPLCGLRFPGPAKIMQDERCPRCKERLESTDIVDVDQEAEDRNGNKQLLRIEVILDNIRSAWNVGSMFRTADGTQLHHLHLCGITPNPAHPTIARTALGAEKLIPWDYHSNSLNLASLLVSSGYRLWVLEDTPDAECLYDVSVPDADHPLLLTVGNEICGVDPELIRLAERVISIPMMGKKRSYNVAVAFGIAASYLRYCQIWSQGSSKKFPRT